MTDSDAFLVALVPLLLVVGVVDARTGRIPNVANAGIAVLGMASAFLQASALLPERLVDATILGALLLLLRHLYAKLRGHAGLGLGDVKFLAAATIWTGLGTMPMVVLAASGTALVAIALMRLAGRKVGARTRLRFGPYLAGALFLMLLAGRFGALLAPGFIAPA